MKTHTGGFKTNISTMGREIDSVITYVLGSDTVELGNEDINSVTPHYKADILKSIMKQLDIDSNVDIPVGTVINYQFGIKVGNAFEYLNYGNYIVNKSERQEDLNSYKITCYDKMLLSMVDYVDVGVEYPVTVRSFINAICTHLGITFANSSDTFVNYDKEIPGELFLSDSGTTLGYKFRDVLDQLAQVTASTICINEDDELEIRYISDTEDTIDEGFLKNVNIDFGKKYGPINSVVLSRSAGSDNIYEKDTQSITTNGLCELKIIDNQIMNDNNRAQYLQEIFQELNGLEYYLNDYSSTGIMYYEMCDRYTVHVGSNNYSCVMLNDEALVTQGLQENIHTDLPVVSETDYSKADKTDRRINQTNLIVDKINGNISSLVEETSVASSMADAAYAMAGQTNSDLQSYKQTVSTQFTQTKNDFLFQFNSLTELIDSATNTESEHYEELQKYIRFVNGIIVLGELGNQITAELSNTKLAFKSNGVEIAYISNDKLYIKTAEIIESLIIGNFGFVPKSNGSLSFKKVK